MADEQMIRLPVPVAGAWGLGPWFQSPHGLTNPKKKEEHRSVLHQPSVSCSALRTHVFSVTSSTVPSNLPLDGLEGINKRCQRALGL